MRDKIALHQYVLFGVLLLLIVLKVLTKNFVFDINLLWWLMGAILGFLFVFTDRFIYSFLMKPNEALNLRLRELFGERRFDEAFIVLLSERHEQKELIMRSALFLMVWIILAFLAVTSISSPLGRGFMLGIGIHLVFDLVYDYFWNKERLEQWFWQIKRVLSADEKRWFVLITSVVIGLMSLYF